MLSRTLDRTMIINGDGTDLNLLKEERIHSADIFVSVTREDETNLLVALLAKELGVQKSIILAHRPDYVPIYERIGVDVAISPRLLTANYIMKFTRPRDINAISLIQDDKAEILEITVKPRSPLAGVPLKDAASVGFPRGAIIGAMVKQGTVIVPDGRTVVEPGDTVIIFTLPSVVSQVEQVFCSPK